MVFRNRREGGQALARRLLRYRGLDDVVVLALPRGGVPVGFEVARRLDAPLDVFLVRRLGVPGHEELAMGALTSGGFLVLNDEVVDGLEIPLEVVGEVAEREQIELARSERTLRGDLPPAEVDRKTVILVDDALATGVTMGTAVAALSAEPVRSDGAHPAKLVVAAPVGCAQACDDLADEADEVVCAVTREPVGGASVWYEDFRQVRDEEVRGLLDMHEGASSI
jgi:predicted phosphoribosyltransferase